MRNKPQKLFVTVGILTLINICLFIWWHHSRVHQEDLPYQCRQSSFSESTKYCTRQQQDRKIFATQFFSDSYYEGVLTMVSSVRKFHPEVPFHVYYFDGKVSQESIDNLKAFGCVVEPIKRIAPSKEMAPSFQRFADQYTKLTLWNMTEYDRIVYLDADTLVLGDLSALLNMPGEITFAAVGDIWENQWDAYRKTFNAGVLSIVPCQRAFEDFMKLMQCQGVYDIGFAEQGMLNYYYEHHYVKLDYRYNLNLALLRDKDHQDLRQTWDRIA